MLCWEHQHYYDPFQLPRAASEPVRVLRHVARLRVRHLRRRRRRLRHGGPSLSVVQPATARDVERRRRPGADGADPGSLLRAAGRRRRVDRRRAARARRRPRLRGRLLHCQRPARLLRAALLLSAV